MSVPGQYIVNVCYDINDPKTRKRELEGLDEALSFFGCRQGYLLTRGHEETLIHGNKEIVILPLWKWLLTS